MTSAIEDPFYESPGYDDRENDGVAGEHECEWMDDMDGGSFCVAPGHPCESSFDIGPDWDPYGVSCDGIQGHHNPHRGINPLPGPGPEPQYVEWEGGGYAAGDPLPVRNRRFLANDGTEVPR